MRNTILIPTDFSGTSLLLLKQVALTSSSVSDVIFLYSKSMPDSITDLLFYSPSRVLNNSIPKEFRDGCSIMKNRYSEKIGSIKYEIFHGNTRNSFRNLVNAFRVDKVILAKDYSLQLSANEFDPTSLILHSGVPIHEVDLNLGTYVREQDLIAQLLTN
ncbi:MAG: hypothetical protein JNL53_14725 [Cyclobacteriaceae bacterium]|nr:hypothetical protein [Cyclobacteriaceae bacterium]